MRFVAFADDHRGAHLARSRAARDPRVVLHASGRPWVVGDWTDDECTEVAVGPNTLLLLGVHDLDPAVAARALAADSPVDELDGLLRSLNGAVHVLLSADGEVYLRGTLSGRCQLVHTTVDGGTVAADRADVLAAVAGRPVDEEMRTLSLLSPDRPWPLSLRTMWTGVEVVPPGSALVVARDGTGRLRRWWSPPEPDLDLAAGADLVRDALQRAVDARTARGGTISADLSGGMDSTSLTFLAARSAEAMVTTHFVGLDETNDDQEWARTCAAGLPRVEHVTVGADENPLWYTPTRVPHGDAEGPSRFARTAAFFEHTAGLVAARGSTRHLQGNGGDELFWPHVLTLHEFVRRRPLAALRVVRSARSMARLTVTDTVRLLAWRRSYPDWLADAADAVADPARAEYLCEWENAPRMPVWATADAVHTARTALRAAARGAEPLAGVPADHSMLRLMHVNGDGTRQSSRLAERYGVTLDAPFLDDRVIEAAMSVRFSDRMVPGTYKPMLAAAMRGVAPAQALRRRTKGDYSADLYAGLARNRSGLVERLCDGEAARLGLIDPDRLRAVLFGVHPDTRPLMPLDATLAAECWLSAVADTPVPVPG